MRNVSDKFAAENKTQILWKTKHKFYGKQNTNIMENKTQIFWKTKHKLYGKQNKFYGKQNANFMENKTQILCSITFSPKS
jgi:hypothetical protein